MKWTLELLQEEADKYQNRGEFWEESSGAASVSSKQKIMDELFKNHPNQGYSENRVKNGTWTKERLQEEADKYQTRGEFWRGNPNAANMSIKKDIMDEIFKNHPNQGYSDVEEWKENGYVIYVYELPEFNKAYVGLTNNMKRRDRDHLFSEKEKMTLFCKENDLPIPKYKILEDNLNKNTVRSQEKYWEQFYRDNGWEMFNINKTGSLGSNTVKWTKKALQEEANKYETRSEFQIGNGAAYTISANKNLLDELFKNHPNQGYSEKQVKSGYWTNEKVQEETNKYKTIDEFRENNGSAYNVAIKKGLMDELFKNHLNQGYSEKKVKSGYWTIEKLQEEVDKYKTRGEFQNKSKSKKAYYMAHEKGLMDELFKNHTNQGYSEKQVKKGYWTIEKLQEEVDKYKTRGEFWEKDKSVAGVVQRKKLMDELFKNHPNQGYTNKK